MADKRPKRPNGAGNVIGKYMRTSENYETKLDHTRKAERALGHSLPKGAQVHHVDGDGLNNDNSNLVICPNAAYHRLLHKRTDALEACGNPDYRKCYFCGEYDSQSALYVSKSSCHHRSCIARYYRDKRRMQSNG